MAFALADTVRLRFYSARDRYGRAMRIGNTAAGYALLVLGLSGLIGLYGADALGLWRMAFPWSLSALVLAAMSAAGLAMVYAGRVRAHMSKETGGGE